VQDPAQLERCRLGIAKVMDHGRQPRRRTAVARQRDRITAPGDIRDLGVGPLLGCPMTHAGGRLNADDTSPEPRGERHSPQAGARTHVHDPCAVASRQGSGEGSTPTLEPIERQRSPLVIAGCHLVVVAASHGRRHRNLASPPPPVHVSCRSYSPRRAAAPGSASVESQSSTSVIRSTATRHLRAGPVAQSSRASRRSSRRRSVSSWTSVRARWQTSRASAVRPRQQFGTGRVQVGVVLQGQAWKARSSPHTGPVP
jgi:hypothetical protein